MYINQEDIFWLLNNWEWGLYGKTSNWDLAELTEQLSEVKRETGLFVVKTLFGGEAEKWGTEGTEGKPKERKQWFPTWEATGSHEVSRYQIPTSSTNYK